MDLEQQRLDLVESNPRLYDYIAAVESASALSGLSEAVAPFDKYASNVAWSASTTAMGRALALLNEPARS
jgi:hypothetical protein